MTRKDYVAAARIVQQTRFPFVGKDIRDEARKILADSFILLFKEDNPRFDESRFLNACFPERTE